MTCKRSKQCDHADLCRFAQSDDYNLLGGSCFTPKDPQTNEQWLCSLSTEEKATFLINATMFYDCGETLPFVGALRKASESDFKPYKWLHKDVVAWLKEIHQ